jgi:hypothetical protein
MFCQLLDFIHFDETLQKIFSIRKEAIQTVLCAVHSMLSMFCHQENPGITCAKNLRKGTKPEMREVLSPHLLTCQKRAKNWQKNVISLLKGLPGRIIVEWYERSIQG